MSVNVGYLTTVMKLNASGWAAGLEAAGKDAITFGSQVDSVINKLTRRLESLRMTPMEIDLQRVNANMAEGSDPAQFAAARSAVVDLHKAIHDETRAASVRQMVEALREQAATVGMNAEQLSIYKAQRLGATQADQEAIRYLQQSIAAYNEQASVQRYLQEQQAKISEVENRPRAEAYALEKQTLAELDALTARATANENARLASIEQMISAEQSRAASVGMSAQAIQQQQLASLGATEADKQRLIAAQQLTAANQQQAQWQARIKEVVQSTIPAAELYRGRIEELRLMLDRGVLTHRQFASAVRAAANEMRGGERHAQAWWKSIGSMGQLQLASVFGALAFVRGAVAAFHQTNQAALEYKKSVASLGEMDLAGHINGLIAVERAYRQMWTGVPLIGQLIADFIELGSNDLRMEALAKSIQNVTQNTKALRDAALQASDAAKRMFMSSSGASGVDMRAFERGIEDRNIAQQRRQAEINQKKAEENARELAQSKAGPMKDLEDQRKYYVKMRDEQAASGYDTTLAQRRIGEITQKLQKEKLAVFLADKQAEDALATRRELSETFAEVQKARTAQDIRAYEDLKRKADMFGATDSDKQIMALEQEADALIKELEAEGDIVRAFLVEQEKIRRVGEMKSGNATLVSENEVNGIEYILGLQENLAKIGKSEYDLAVAKAYELERQGVLTREQRDMAIQIAEETERAQKAMEAQNRLKSWIEGMKERIKTPQEKAAEQYDMAARAYATGELSADQYDKVKSKIAEDAAGSTGGRSNDNRFAAAMSADSTEAWKVRIGLGVGGDETKKQTGLQRRTATAVEKLANRGTVVIGVVGVGAGGGLN